MSAPWTTNPPTANSSHLYQTGFASAKAHKEMTPSFVIEKQAKRCYIGFSIQRKKP